MSDTTLTRPTPTRQPRARPVIPPPKPSVVDEHELYPIHEEDNVPEKPLHETQVRYLRDALTAHFPNRWVTGDICMYWEERSFHQYAAPDVLVVDCEPADPTPDVHLKWVDPPALLVIEVGSRSTFVRDEGPKLDIYGFDLQIPEYIYYHPTRHHLYLYRLAEKGYETVLPDARGWVYSNTLDVWFGEDASRKLRIFTPGGDVLLSHQETHRARQEAEARAATETLARQETEARVADMEKRLAELEAEAKHRRL